MNALPLLLFFSLMIPSSSSSTTSHSLNQGSSLSVEKPNDVLISPNGVFSAGFYPVGDNAYCFAIWFTESSINSNSTVVWMANRDLPVNGRGSALSLLGNGNLVLTDGGRSKIWTTNAPSTSLIQLSLCDTGNLVLQTFDNVTLWQSFDFPTDTLLPQQPLTRNLKLVSSRSRGNYSSGFYSLYFDNDNIVRLLFNGPEISSIYWPDPGHVSWEVGRTTYNNSRIAVFDSSGYFQSSDDLKFFVADFGLGPKRRLTVDFDGNLRLYSFDEKEGNWDVSWQAINQPCSIHGVCGPNSLCLYRPEAERRCSCLPGFKIKDPTDWTYGCEPKFNLSRIHESSFIELPHVEFYGYDISFFPDVTLESCEAKCLEFPTCKAFLYKASTDHGVFNCYPKSLLLNGFRSPDFQGIMHLRIPKDGFGLFYNESLKDLGLHCSEEAHIQLLRIYGGNHDTPYVKYLFWFVGVIGGVEIICIFLVWFFLFKTYGHSSVIKQGYLLAATGFRKFTYEELKKATRGFKEEIGRGGGGIVYKGVLSDRRIAAIKQLDHEANKGGEFLAEVSTIGRINHMNLIEIWGFCAEGKHRLLVCEYMENGSLAKNLSSNTLDFEKRFEIAVGTAKGLAYLHEESLEWVLHCDVKPHNILLDANYKPKVADFGLSKLYDRGKVSHSSFSRMRGTRGYMAPEWIFDLPITSKVDVYSYGIVVLELVTGMSPVEFNVLDTSGEREVRRLVTWVREKMSATNILKSRTEEMVDPRLEDQYDPVKMEVLIRVALQCVEEEKDARPTMSQVVEMLLCHEKDHREEDDYWEFHMKRGTDTGNIGALDGEGINMDDRDREDGLGEQGI